MNISAVSRFFFIVFLFTLASFKGISQDTSQRYFHILFASDMHFGIKKKTFRGETNVPSKEVNTSMVASMNHLPKEFFPNDSGVQAGSKIDYIDYLFITGDVANRMQPPVQTSKTSWQQFLQVYEKGLKTKNPQGKRSPILVSPGN
ncbi:MAG: hypothetical protein DI598_20270, partial [Pseudopedobacter saltans]